MVIYALIATGICTFIGEQECIRDKSVKKKRKRLKLTSTKVVTFNSNLIALLIAISKSRTDFFFFYQERCNNIKYIYKIRLSGCGRTKLFWVLALADSCTLKSMVEFREGSKSKSTGTGVCRFCGATGNSGLLAIGNVCADQECQEHAKNICNKVTFF